MHAPQKNITVKNKLGQQERFKVSKFKEVIKRTSPHKHDAYLELVYLSQGSGYHWIDTRKFQITPPVMFFLSGQLHWWEITEVPKGYVMIFREDFFDPIKHRDVLDLIASLEGTVDISLPPGDLPDFIFAEMEKEYRNPARHTVEVIHGYLKVLLVKILRYKDRADALPLTTHDKVLRDFRQLIRNANPLPNLKVSEAAAYLHLSPQKLNAICRRATGKQASALIIEQVVLEAKRYLLHSDKTIGEIAFSMKFSDTSHFVKYFKRATGQTPQAFRHAALPRLP